MQPRDGTTAVKRQGPLQRLAAQLDAAELDLTVREIEGEHHSQYDVVDSERRFTHRADCPWCAFRNLASKYRAMARAPVIKRGHNDARRLPSLLQLWNAESIAKARLRDTPEDRRVRYQLEECGDPIPLAQTMSEKINVQAELEMIELDYELARWRMVTARNDAHTMRGLLS